MKATTEVVLTENLKALSCAEKTGSNGGCGRLSFRS